MSNKRKLVSARTGVIVAAAAATAAAASWERAHRRVAGADLTDTELHVQRLSDLRHETAMLDEIERGLSAEWGAFAFLGFDDVREMASEAGQTIFVVVERGEGGVTARGIVQTILTDVHGEPQLLENAYRSFADLTSRASWKASRHAGGDTAVLLQITTLGPPDQRGGGLGSLLRNAVLNMLPRSVEWALTMTPIDGVKTETIDMSDTSTYTPAMRFHSRGGAIPSRILPAFKTPEEGSAETAHGRDIIVMRYARDAEGAWPAKRPPMRVRSVGPLQERVLRTGRSLKTRGLKAPRLHAPSLHAPSFHRPELAMPHFGDGGPVIRGIKRGADRLRHRGEAEEAAAPVEPIAAEAADV